MRTIHFIPAGITLFFFLSFTLDTQSFLLINNHFNDHTTKQTDGKTLYYKYNCKSCHGKSGTGPMGNLRKAVEKYTDDQMRAYIRKPSDFNNKKMPAFANVIPDKDLTVLIQYVRELAVSR